MDVFGLLGDCMYAYLNIDGWFGSEPRYGRGAYVFNAQSRVADMVSYSISPALKRLWPPTVVCSHFDRISRPIASIRKLESRPNNRHHRPRQFEPLREGQFVRRKASGSRHQLIQIDDRRSPALSLPQSLPGGKGLVISIYAGIGEAVGQCPARTCLNIHTSMLP